MDPTKYANMLYRHDLAAEDLSHAEADEIGRILNTAIEEMKDKIIARHAKDQASGKINGPATTKRIETYMEGLDAINSKVYSRIGKRLEDGLIKRARQEIKFANDAAIGSGASRVDVDTRIPDTNYLRTLVNTTPIPIDPHSAATLQPWLKGMEEGNINRLRATLQSGLASGEATADLVKRIEKGGFAKSRRSAQGIAITANASVANAARLETFRKMRGVTHVEWSSVNDSKTSDPCIALSGKIFDIEEPHPVPPIHPRCRSTLLPRKNDTDPPLHTPHPKQKKETAKGPTKTEPKRPRGPVTTPEALAKADAKITAPERFTTPINPAVTAQTIKVRPRKDVVKALNERLAIAAADSRYDLVPEFKGVKAENFGKVAFASGFSDEASSVILELMPELDTLADVFKIPRLRAIRPVAGPIANMGDGTLGLNATYFNSYSATVGEAGGATAAAEAKVAKLAAEMEPLRAKLAKLKEAFDKARAAGDQAAYMAIYAEQQPIAKAYHKLSKSHFAAKSKVRTAERVTSQEVSNWKPGDDTKTRPYNSTDYFTGIDKARNVLFHEFGHHVHQMVAKTGRRRVAGTPPVEKRISLMFNAKFFKLGVGREEKAKLASTYATTNAHEWFAEGFATYMMGRKDLTDPDLIKLIEELLNG